MLLRSSEIKPLFSSRDLISFLKENLFFLFLLNLYLRLFITDSAFPTLFVVFLLEVVIFLFLPDVAVCSETKTSTLESCLVSIITLEVINGG